MQPTRLYEVQLSKRSVSPLAKHQGIQVFDCSEKLHQLPIFQILLPNQNIIRIILHCGIVTARRPSCNTTSGSMNRRSSLPGQWRILCPVEPMPG